MTGIHNAQLQHAGAPRHRVVCFRHRDDYRRSLRSVLPDVDTEGLYMDRVRTAYFFVSPDADDRTLYHEATHQLFHESRPVAPDLARRANFWIIEGIALYMESLHEEYGFHVLGGVIAPLEGVGPDQLRLSELVVRVRTGGVSEVILATNPTIEGDTTALYIQRILKETDVTVTRLASGLPVGGDLEYADRLTLARSFRGRSSF